MLRLAEDLRTNFWNVPTVLKQRHRLTIGQQDDISQVWNDRKNVVQRRDEEQRNEYKTNGKKNGLDKFNCEQHDHKHKHIVQLLMACHKRCISEP